MGATGVVIPEYRDKLSELGDRLGLSADAAKAMFHAAIRLRMEPMMQQVRVPMGLRAAGFVCRSEAFGLGRGQGTGDRGGGARATS